MPTAEATPKKSRSRRPSVHRFVPAAFRPLTIRLGLGARDLGYRAMNLASRPHPKPLFVLGNQKSGTTAIAAVFARATGQSVTLDLTREVWNPTYFRIPSGALSFDEFVARNRWGFSRDIIKEPNLTLFHRELEQRFPDASYLFVVRDPRDNIRSILNRLKIPGDLDVLPDSALSTANPESTPAWAYVFDGDWRGIGGRQYIDRLAHRWRFCLDLYQRHAAEMALCRYEDFLTDKLATIARLAEDLGRPVVHDASDRLDVQYRHRGDNSQPWAEFFGPENLARIESICAEGIEKMGYPASASGPAEA